MAYPIPRARQTATIGSSTIVTIPPTPFVHERSAAVAATATVGSSYSQVILADTPALYWRLGESAGTNANDETANNRDGTYTGSYSLSAAGAVPGDTAVDLSGGRITSTYNPFTIGSVRTYEAWVNQDTAVDGNTIFANSVAHSAGNFMAYIAATDLQFYINFEGSGGVTGIWSAALPASGWAHVVLLVDDGADSVELYVNGVSAGSAGFGSPNTSYNASPGTFQIGAWDSGIDPMDGKVDEVAVYERALSAGEITEHYEASAPGYEVDHIRSVAVAAAGAISTSATFYSIFERSSAVGATGTVTASGARVASRSTSLDAAAAVTASGTFWTTFERASVVSSTGAVTSSAVRIVERSAALGATGTVTGAPQRDLLRSATLSATADVLSAGKELLPRSAALSATASVTTAYERELQRAVSANATAAISTIGEIEGGIVAHEGSASLSASGSVTSSGRPVLVRSASVGATADFASAAEFWSVFERNATLAATGAIASASQRVSVRAASLDAAGAIATAAQRDLLRTAALGATGQIASFGFNPYAFTYTADPSADYGGTPVQTYDGTPVTTYDGTADSTYDNEDEFTYR